MYSCLEHIDEAMDRFLDDEEKLPILERVDEGSLQKCNLCQQDAAYKLEAGEMEIDF